MDTQRNFEGNLALESPPEISRSGNLFPYLHGHHQDQVFLLNFIWLDLLIIRDHCRRFHRNLFLQATLQQLDLLHSHLHHYLIQLNRHLYSLRYLYLRV